MSQGEVLLHRALEIAHSIHITHSKALFKNPAQRLVPLWLPTLTISTHIIKVCAVSNDCRTGTGPIRSKNSLLRYRLNLCAVNVNRYICSNLMAHILAHSGPKDLLFFPGYTVWRVKLFFMGKNNSTQNENYVIIDSPSCYFRILGFLKVFQRKRFKWNLNEGE